MKNKIKEIKEVLFSESLMQLLDHPFYHYDNEEVEAYRNNKTINPRLDFLDDITEYLQYKKVIDFVVRQDDNRFYIWHNVHLHRDIGMDEKGNAVDKDILWGHTDELFGKTLNEVIESLAKIQNEIDNVKFYNKYGYED